MSPLWGEKLIFEPLSKNNTSMAVLRAGLPVIKHRKLSKYCHGKRSDSTVLATTEGEIEGKLIPERRRTAWIDDVRR